MSANLIFCLNATMPVFLLLLLGMLFMKQGIFDETFIKKINNFVFKIALPVLVFHDMCGEDFYQMWDAGYVLFCLTATALSIAITTGISFLLPDKSSQGEFIQAAFRSSAAILGLAMIQSLYGSSGMGPLMIIGSVPLYNVMAVVILAFFKPERAPMDKKLLAEAGKGILHNHIIWGVFLGLFWGLLQLPMPQILETAVENVGRLATPLGILAMGAAFDLKEALKSAGAAGLASFIKLVGLGLLFVPAAVYLGFRGDKLVAILIMCCSSTTVSSYVMAKNMGHDGTLTSSAVMVTTFFLSFTLTAWLFVLKSLGLL